MKNRFAAFMVLLVMFIPARQKEKAGIINPSAAAENLVIITLDGFRWQELFSGADTDLLENETITPDGGVMQALYGGSNSKERREALLPFFWKFIAQKGQLYGNREEGNKMNVANWFSISYPGYNEMLTATTDLTINSNNKYVNPNSNILEYLDSKPAFTGKVAAFASWDVFPFILNKKRNELPINSGYEKMEEVSANSASFNAVQEMISSKSATRKDRLTFIAAKEYLKEQQPRVLFLGFGETDECAHQNRYDLYLQKANEADRMIAELWHWIQTTPGYKDHTTLLITTDHGRGEKDSKWSKHGLFTKGSSQTWMALIGPNIEPLGEIKEEQQIWQKQVAQTIAAILGEDFSAHAVIASATPLR